ncbi:hypothetical protein Agub_g9255 [Astrephomene gubernaculifera]|uniref:Protein ENHANCED DISEASE RESISTANCE 2 C-terminal domain-containing protein n=1 Tax=Astrephomene gubernaculifera TaxID=47775 RepID=A0AAD3DT16_9CHLO|nr:hypothetical protein Agub_g9255 [Astrephomene gubernaculifera]
MSPFCCCFGRRTTNRRSTGRSHEAAGKTKDGELQSPLSCNSFTSEYYDAQEHFPAGEASSPTCSTAPRHSIGQEKGLDEAHGPGPHHHHHHRYPPSSHLCGVDAAVSLDTCPSTPPHHAGLVATTTTSTTTTTGGDTASSCIPPDAAARGFSCHLVGSSEASEEPLQAAGGPIAKLASCLTILDNIRMPALPTLPTLPALPGAAAFAGSLPFIAGGGPCAGGGGEAAEAQLQQQPGVVGGVEEGPAGGAAGGRPTARSLGGKLEPGCTLRRRDMSESVLEVREAWEPCSQDEGGGGAGPQQPPCTSGRPFMVRGPDYMKTRVKIPSRPALYRLLAADVISTDTKMTHVARLVNLQQLLRPALAADPHLPPLLIFTIMLPMYPATLFGGNDGQSQSLVYYFGLPPDFKPAEYENQTALALLRRFVTNGREADGSPTRDRLKIIPRVVNVDEWAQKGPLSPAEHKLLAAYNDKPVLARPQHHFFTGPGYLEVDVDIHCYQFLARKALCSFFTRLQEVIFENAIVIQGNSPEELPEQVLAAVRMYRVDLLRSRPLRNFIAQQHPAQPQGQQGQHQQQQLPQQPSVDGSQLQASAVRQQPSCGGGAVAAEEVVVGEVGAEASGGVGRGAQALPPPIAEAVEER